MNIPLRKLFFFSAFFLLVILVSRCGTSTVPTRNIEGQPVPADPWLGHNDSAHYVGMNTCKQCHYAIYETFIKTGMGQSFDSASRSKSSGKFEAHTVIYDTYSNFYYHPFWKGNKYFIREFRLDNKDTVFNRVEQVSFIIGSGQHTNSHILNSNGYLHQMPMTFYTQKGKWDLPPGFENGSNTRFSRKIGLECMSCHNAYPDFVEGSENKYKEVQHGIDCERCHGPGSVHVSLKQQGVKIDTNTAVDYSIVNPGKLKIDRQFDLCMRCHLQGDAVLKSGKSFYDFKPGMVLSDFITVFMPRYKGGDDQFIMASHAARLKMSKCFIQSAQTSASAEGLRPYKDGLTCVTCHNPHVSVKVTGTGVFNAACMNCHRPEKKNGECTASMQSRILVKDNCVSCHMPRSGSVDIPHVTVHDHYIRKPEPRADRKSVKQFIGLYAVNDDHPDAATRAKGYVNYYEKFDPKNKALLDSAQKYLPQAGATNWKEALSGLVQIYFLKRDYAGITSLCEKAGKEWVLKECLKQQSLSNENAWTAYRIGESYDELGSKNDALLFYRKATALAPFQLDFQNKMGLVLLDLGKKEESAKTFDYIIGEDPEYASAWNNRGRLYFYESNLDKAGMFIDKALALDPDLLSALKNKVDLYNAHKEYEAARTLLLKIMKKYPGDTDAKSLLEKMKQLKLIKA
ncbi:MAG TPA: tetratricopeptide repeat protein [Bacteroidia bacterium]|jgi:tetratricopeptide (TPR) repeat protein|nr:tetratricopeptide repeat protein [Bacteroidia bacterium]